ncbi:MAG: glucokinase [Gammaproteobacteria bacterium]|nr:glucokinase [Gammaproteobacteria bacterium]
MKSFDLIADVGGTNIRLALVDDETITEIECFKCDDHSSLEAVVSHYVELKQVSIVNACFGIAGPVVDKILKMTNLGWSFSAQSVKNTLGCDHVSFINDYTAITMSLPALKGDQLVTIHAAPGEPDAPRVVCGPGTGLGLAQLVKVNGFFECLSGEGGHVEFAPANQRQIALLSYLMNEFERVSAERLLSGQGIVNIYQALAFIDGEVPQSFDASQISQGFTHKTDKLCIETMEIFYQVLAQFVGNIVLTSGAFGGVYIAGGIMPRIIDHIDFEKFIEAYSHKGRFKNYVLKSPVYLITESQPGLIGASVYLKQLKQKGNN